jgi:hypothetical protein
MTEEVKPDYKTLEGLKKHPMYQQLTDNQRLFLIAYIESDGNRNLATAKVSKTARPDLYAIRNLRLPNIKALLVAYYGKTEDVTPLNKTELKQMLVARLRNPECSDRTFILLLDQYRSLVGTKAPRTGPELVRPQVDTIDTLVQQIEAQRKQ